MYRIMVIILLSLCSHCIGVKHDYVKKVNYNRSISNKRQQISVNYLYYITSPDPMSNHLAANRKKIYSNVLIKRWQDSRDFDFHYIKYNINKSVTNKKSKYSLVVKLHQIEYAQWYDYLWAITSGATLTIIPFRTTERFILSIDLYDNSKTKLKSFKYTDKVSAWVQAFLLPLTPFYWPYTIEDEVVENMYIKALSDIENYYERNKMKLF